MYEDLNEYMHHQIRHTHWMEEVPESVYAFWKCKLVKGATIVSLCQHRNAEVCDNIYHCVVVQTEMSQSVPM